MSSPTRNTGNRPALHRAPRPERLTRAARPATRAGLAGVWLSLAVLVAGCGFVGKGPDPDPGVDMSRPADLVTPPMCTPKNCAGCCLGDVCQPGITIAACGTAGAACAQCSDAQKCGIDFMCSFDPNATWLVAAVQATLSPTNSTGVQWRADGTMPQPLVQFDLTGRTQARAIVVTGTPPNQVWTVTWGMGFTYAAKDLLSTGLDLQVLDQLTAMTTQTMSGKHHVTFSQQDFAGKNLIYQGWEGVKTLSITLQRQ